MWELFGSPFGESIQWCQVSFSSHASHPVAIRAFLRTVQEHGQPVELVRLDSVHFSSEVRLHRNDRQLGQIQSIKHSVYELRCEFVDVDRAADSTFFGLPRVLVVFLVAGEDKNIMI